MKTFLFNIYKTTAEVAETEVKAKDENEAWEIFVSQDLGTFTWKLLNTEIELFVQREKDPKTFSKEQSEIKNENFSFQYI